MSKSGAHVVWREVRKAARETPRLYFEAASDIARAFHKAFSHKTRVVPAPVRSHTPTVSSNRENKSSQPGALRTRRRKQPTSL